MEKCKKTKKEIGNQSLTKEIWCIKHCHCTRNMFFMYIYYICWLLLFTKIVFTVSRHRHHFKLIKYKYIEFVLLHTN